MAFQNLRSLVCRPVAGQYFFFGMIVGITIGLFLMAPLNRFTIEKKYFKSNFTNFESPATTEHNLNHILDTRTSTLKVNETLAEILYDEVKVLCWIMTGPKNHEAKARHVKETWGKRCNILLFMSTQEDPNLPSIALPVIEDRDNLWGKTKEAFKHIYKHYFDKADWFFKADDDTYAIMENMRFMLRNKNTSHPIYFGYRFKPFVNQGYMSGGAGYVLSKEALRRFINESLPDPKKCKEANVGNEDLEMGKCLEAVGVEAGDSRDNEGKDRFMPIFVSPVLTPGEKSLPKNHWLWGYNYYPLNIGMECCSDYMISIHYVDTRTMYLLEYIIYHVKPFGVPYFPSFDENLNKATNKSVDNVVQENKISSTQSALVTKKNDTV